MVSPPLERPIATYRSILAPLGGYRVEIDLLHFGPCPLIDLYQEAPMDHASLLHPHDAPPSFLPCPCAAAPGWTCLGAGPASGECAGPFVAWCAQPPRSFKMRWRAEDPNVGGMFEIFSAR